MDNGKVEENCDEDGERGVGYRIINLMRSLKVCNIAVCISRWYSQHMGPQRFNDICMCATDAIVQLELPKYDGDSVKNDDWQRPREKQFNRFEGTGNRTRRYGQRQTDRYGKPQSYSRQWSQDEASDNYQRNSYSKRHGGEFIDHVTHKTGRQQSQNPQNNNSNTFSPEWLNSQNNADYQKNNYNYNNMYGYYSGNVPPSSLIANPPLLENPQQKSSIQTPSQILSVPKYSNPVPQSMYQPNPYLEYNHGIPIGTYNGYNGYNGYN